MRSVTVVTVVEKRPVSNIPPLEYPPLWKVLHDLEMGKVRQVVLDRGVPLPEVLPMAPNHYTPFTAALQRLSYAINPELTPDEWTALYTYQRFMTNHNGFGNQADPRANYIKGTNLSSPLPKQENLFCGGAIVTGTPIFSAVEAIRQAAILAREIVARRASFLGFRRSVQELTAKNVLNVWTLDGRGEVPTAEWILARPWTRFAAVSVNPRGQIHNLHQGGQDQVKWILLLADRRRYPTVTYPLSKLKRIPAGAPLPNHLVIGA